MDKPSSSVANNLFAIRQRIAQAAQKAGRQPDEITLVAITKTVPVDQIREAFEAGVVHFGESRVQEWESKAPLVHDLPALWHMVGHLQRNKAARAVDLFHSVDSLDTLPLAEKLEAAAGDGRRIPVLIEVRLDPVAHAKSGCNPEEAARLAEGVLLLPHLDLRGLMAVPPFSEDAEQTRPIFRRLRELRDELAHMLHRPLHELSMGMSHDFEIAIEEGATQIRIGAALFGTRPGIQ